MAKITAPLPSTFGSYGARSWSIQKPVNCYLTPAEHDTKTPLIIRPCSGLKAFGDTTVSTFQRGAIFWNNAIYFVAGDQLYRCSELGEITTVTLNPFGGANAGGGLVNITEPAIGGDGPVSMAANSSQIAIVSPETGNGYVVSGDPLTVDRIGDADWPGAASVAVLDSIGIFERQNSNEFVTSNVENFAAINALDFSSAERNPDPNRRVIVDHAELWVMGAATVEVFQNVGGDFPFRRVPGVIIERGLAARFGVVKEDNSLFWLGDDGSFYRANGYTPLRVSNRAVEEAIEGGYIGDAEAMAWTERGSKFVAWRFPSRDMTLVFDVSTGLWHQRGSGDLAEDLWQVAWVIRAWGKNICGATDGRVYQMDPNTFSEGGATISRQMVFAPIYGEGRRIRHLTMDCEMEVGQGLATGQGSDPTIWLDWSNDGHEWSNELSRSLGAQGKYRKRVRWNRLGSARERTYRLRITDPVEWALMDAKLDVAAGR